MTLRMAARKRSKEYKPRPSNHNLDTKTGLAAALKTALENGWGQVILVKSGLQLDLKDLFTFSTGKDSLREDQQQQFALVLENIDYRKIEPGASHRRFGGRGGGPPERVTEKQVNDQLLELQNSL